MSKVKAYITAFRLRTLPLAVSSVLMGNIIAAYQGDYHTIVGVLAVITTVLLQILSNVANDYGDAVSGADNEHRIGPERMVASGKISIKEMKVTVIVMSILSLITGVFLIANGNFASLSIKSILLFIVGIAAIVAAIKYTVGKNPYGYNGMGDIFVFLFFGWVGVVGTYFLHTGTIDMWILLPASTVGLLSAGVLNLNNMRDENSDKNSGKNTLVVKKGGLWAKKYHAFMLIVAMVLMLAFSLIQNYNWYQYFYILAFPLIVRNLIFVIKNKVHQDYNPELKKLALATFFMTLLFGIGLFIG